MVVTYHDTENRPKGGICVANHTTPIDIMTLACDNAYALTGQRHGGFNGYFQVLLLVPHILSGINMQTKQNLTHHTHSPYINQSTERGVI